jgi:hypothetical protein|eukprot:COSAG01_NODE_7344_length_3242_cov_7.433344_2_plen_92_part_00
MIRCVCLSPSIIKLSAAAAAAAAAACADSTPPPLLDLVVSIDPTNVTDRVSDHMYGSGIETYEHQMCAHACINFYDALACVRGDEGHGGQS